MSQLEESSTNETESGALTQEVDKTLSGETLILLRQLAKDGHGDYIREEIYRLARLGQLRTDHILLLEIIRNEESRCRLVDIRYNKR